MIDVPESEEVVYEGMCRWIEDHRVPFEMAFGYVRPYCPACLGDQHPDGAVCPEVAGGDA